MRHPFHTSDARLVRRTLAGHDDGFNALVRRYERVAFACAYGIVANTTDAEDVTQEAFLSAYAKLDTLRDPAKFRSWLMTIVRHQSADVLTDRRKRKPLEDAEPSVIDAAESVDDADLRRVLRDRIEKLPADHREVLLLHYYGGLKVRELADQLGISTEAAKKRLQRARTLLTRRMLDQLTDSVEEQSQSNARVKTIIALISGASAAWKTSAAAAATGAVTIGAGMKLGLGAVATVSIVSVVVWTAQPGDQAPEPPASSVSETTPDTVDGADIVASTTTTPDTDSTTASTGTSQGEPVTASTNAVIRGQVVTASGAAQPGIRVTLDRSAAVNGSIGKTTTTDERGGFEFTSLSDESMYALQAFGDRAFAAGEHRARTPDHKSFEETELVLRPSADLTGVVVDDQGEPVAGAAVLPESFLEDGDRQSVRIPWQRLRGATTDARGRFRLTHAWLTDWSLEVDSPDHTFRQIDNLHPEKSPHRVRVVRGGIVEGRVVYRNTDRGVPNLEFNLGHRREVVTDATGNFRRTGVGMAAQARLHGPTDLIVVSPDLTVVPGRVLDDVRIEVARGGTISGRVIIEETGEPVRHHSLDFEKVGSNDSKSAAIQKDGRYRVSRLEPGQWEVTGTYGFALARDELEPVTIDYGVNVSNYDIYLKEGRTLSGNVVIPPDMSWEDLQVELHYESDEDKNHQVSTTRGSNGAFKKRGLPTDARVSVTAHLGDWSSDTAGPFDLANGNVEGIELTLAHRRPAGATISGRVVYGNNLPRAGEHVWLSVTNGTNNSGGGTAVSDRDGNFRFKNVKPGEYVIRAAMPYGAQAAVQVLGKRDVSGIVLDLGGGSGTIAGRVVDWEGNPVANARLYAHGPRPDLPDVRTDEDGRYEFKGAKDGHYTIGIQTEEFGNQRRKEVTAGSRNVDFELKPKGHAAGRVLDARTGKPIKEFGLTVHHDPNPTSLQWSMRNGSNPKRSSADGSFALPNLPPQEVGIIAFADGYYPGYVLAEIPPAAVLEDLRIRLEPAPVQFVQVTAPDGTPVNGAIVMLNEVDSNFNNAPFNERLSSTDAAGFVAVNNLLRGANDVFIVHPDHGRMVAAIDANRASESVTLRFPETAGVEGVIAYGGAPVSADVSVQMGGENLSWGFGTYKAKTDDNGAFTLTDVMPGEGQLVIRAQTVTYTQPILLEAGRTVTANFDTDLGDGAIDLTLLLPERAARMQMSIIARANLGAGEVMLFGRAGQGDVIQFEGLPAGDVTVLVAVPDTTNENRRLGGALTVPVGPGERVAATLDLVSGPSISGVVGGMRQGKEYWAVLLTGAVGPDEIQNGGMAFQFRVAQQQVLDATGQYQFDGVPPGTYTLVAGLDGLREFAHRVVEVRDSDQRIDMQLP